MIKPQKNCKFVFEVWESLTISTINKFPNIHRKYNCNTKILKKVLKI